MHDTSSPTVLTQYMKQSTHSLFGTNQRPECRQTPISSTQGARAKSTFARLKGLYVQQEAQPKSTTQPAYSDSDPQANPQTAESQSSSANMQPTSSRSEGPKRPLVRKIQSRKGGPSDPKPKQDESVDQVDNVKQSTNQKFDAKLSPQLLQQQANESQHDETETQKHAKENKKPEGKVTSIKEEMLQQRKEAKREKKKAYRERRETFRENNPEHLELQKLRKRQGFAVRRVAAGPPSDAAEAGKAKLTVEDIGEKARMSGKILARLTEQLRLVTRLKGSELEGLTRRRAKNGTKRLASTTPPSGGRQKGVVRTVTPKAQDVEEIGSDEGKLSPYTSYTLGTADLQAPEATDRQRRIASHRSPSGLDFVMRSIPLSPVSPSPHSPPPRPRDFQSFLTHLQGGLRVIAKRTRLLHAQLSASLPTTPDPIPVHKHAARIAATARSQIVYGPGQKTQLRHNLGLIHGRAKRIIKRTQILSAHVSALLPGTPVPIAKHGVRIIPRSHVSRRPEQLTTRTTDAQTRTKRRTARHILLAARRLKTANRPLSEKVRYGDGRAFAGARWKTLKPRVSRKGFRGQRQALRFLLVGDRVQARRVRAGRGAEKTLEDDVRDWLEGGGM